MAEGSRITSYNVCYTKLLRQSCSLAQQQHLDKQPPERVEVAIAEVSNRVVVRMLIAAQDAVSNVLIGGLLNLARRPLAGAIGIEQQCHHHHRVKPGPAAPVLHLIGRGDIGQVLV